MRYNAITTLYRATPPLSTAAFTISAVLAGTSIAINLVLPIAPVAILLRLAETRLVAFLEVRAGEVIPKYV